MSHSLANVLRPAPLDTLQTELRPMVKADLKKVQKAETWAREGAAIAVAISLARKSRKEAASLIDISESQLAGQIAGAERPQTERFEADPVFAAPMAVAKAMQRPDVFEVTWTITARVTR